MLHSTNGLRLSSFQTFIIANEIDKYFLLITKIPDLASYVLILCSPLIGKHLQHRLLTLQWVHTAFLYQIEVFSYQEVYLHCATLDPFLEQLSSLAEYLVLTII